MTRVLPALLVLAAPAACTLAPDQASQGQTGVDSYHQLFRFDRPVPAELFVATRTVDEAAAVASYQVAVDDRPLELVYRLDPAAAAPLTIEVYDATTAAMLAAIAADDHALTIADATGPLVEVAGYVDPPTAVVRAVAPATLPAAAVQALHATLATRVELGAVPGFLQNRADVHAVGGGVSSSSSEARPLLPRWDAPVSVLGAWTLAAVCVTGEPAGFACDFCTWSTAAAGDLTGTACP